MFSPLLNGNHFGMDFNPAVDRIRIVSDLDQNLRAHPDTGLIVSSDLTLKYAAGDVNEGKNPFVVSAAYTNNFAGTTTTTLYDIDSQRNVLVTQVPPNDGVLNTIGPLGVDVNQLTGFDITAGNTAFASFDVGPNGSQLYTINLATGAATLVGNIGENIVVRDIAVRPGAVTPPPSPIIGANRWLAAPAVASDGATAALVTTNQPADSVDAQTVTDNAQPVAVPRALKRPAADALDQVFIDKLT